MKADANTTPKVLYSYTEGPIIAAKLKHVQADEVFIRMGISFPLDNSYKSTMFKPEQDYCSVSLLSYLLELCALIDEERQFTIRKADLCYGGSVKMIDMSKQVGRESVYMNREPLEQHGLSLSELKKICDTLSGVHREVAFYRAGEYYLSAAIPYNPLTEKFGVSMDVFDIKIPKQVLGCRVEFALPEQLYDYKIIEEPFDAVARHVNFGKLLAELEHAHEDFLELVERSRERKKLKVVKRVKV